jgi:hypothetical protein
LRKFENRRKQSLREKVDADDPVDQVQLANYVHSNLKIRKGEQKGSTPNTTAPHGNHLAIGAENEEASL